MNNDLRLVCCEIMRALRRLKWKKVDIQPSPIREYGCRVPNQCAIELGRSACSKIAGSYIQLLSQSCR